MMIALTTVETHCPSIARYDHVDDHADPAERSGPNGEYPESDSADDRCTTCP